MSLPIAKPFVRRTGRRATTAVAAAGTKSASQARPGPRGRRASRRRLFHATAKGTRRSAGTSATRGGVGNPRGGQPDAQESEDRRAQDQRARRAHRVEASQQVRAEAAHDEAPGEERREGERGEQEEGAGEGHGPSPGVGGTIRRAATGRGRPQAV